IYTDDEEIKTGVNAAIGAIRSRFGSIRFHRYGIRYQDITDYDSLKDFLKVFVRVIRDGKDHGADRIYLNVTGGRKIQGIVMSMYAGLAGINKVYNVINKDVRNYNENFEKIKDEIMKDFRDVDEKTATDRYLKDEKLYDPVFYPDPESLSYIELPVISLPRNEIEMLKRLLNGIPIEDSGVRDFTIDAYVKSGLIFKDKSRVYPKEIGEIIRDLLQ
ncbi:CRISPR-associated ring nuclease, partial [Thermoplasma sp.]|uniref:CRISPR-associated ring nuclease n=1 Tax=Thermoplasma sp. TaxID=1973142 RepID=UPI0026080655